MAEELDAVRAGDVSARRGFPPRIGICSPGGIGCPAGFPVEVLSKGGAVTDGWGASEAFLRELALGGDEFVEDLALSH